MGVAGDSPVEEAAVSEQSVEFRVLELGWSKKPGGAEGEGKAHEWRLKCALLCLA